MKKVTFTKYDTAEVIIDKEDVLVFLEGALEENDPEYLLRIIDAITRSKGITKIAKEMKLSRKSLYNLLVPDGNPSFNTVFKLLDILGLQIKLVPKSPPTQSEAIAK
jgi:probable addiction module antidote protein